MVLPRVGRPGEPDVIQLVVTEAPESDVDKVQYQKPAYVAVVLVVIITAIAIFFPMLIMSTVIAVKKTLVPISEPRCAADACRSFSPRRRPTDPGADPSADPGAAQL